MKVFLIIYFGFGIFLSYFLTHTLGLNAIGAWIANVIIDLLTSICFIHKYYNLKRIINLDF